MLNAWAICWGDLVMWPWPCHQVFCGHEYSLQNLAFGKHVEPDNQVLNSLKGKFLKIPFEHVVQHIIDKISWCQQMRSASPPQPTVPSTIAEEHLINPFMRVTHNCLSKHSSFLKMSSYPRLLSPVCRPTQARVSLWRPWGRSGLRRITSRANSEKN